VSTKGKLWVDTKILNIKNNIQRKWSEMKTKICKDCGVEKPLSEYYKAVTCKDGYRGDCKACYNYRVKTYKENPIVKERNKVSATLWKANNKDKIREYNKKYRYNAYLKYKETEHGKLANKRKRHKRRAIMENAGTFTNEQWQERLAEYNYCCAYCYNPFPVNELTIDHMLPLSRGGTNTIDNLVPSCKPCNSRKKDKTPLEMLQKGLM
jgi:5-methylcytosine-specific restriction endonuclease McrA